MQTPRFDLKLAFVVMSNACVLAWAVVVLSFNHRPNIAALPIAACFASTSCAWYGLSKSRRPTVVGLWVGVAAAAAMTIGLFTQHGLGYFFYTGTDEYFKDGAFAELVVVPPLFFLVYGALFGLLGLICGWLVSAAQKCIGWVASLNRAKTSNSAIQPPKFSERES